MCSRFYMPLEFNSPNICQRENKNLGANGRKCDDYVSYVNLTLVVEIDGSEMERSWHSCFSICIPLLVCNRNSVR